MSPSDIKPTTGLQLLCWESEGLGDGTTDGISGLFISGKNNTKLLDEVFHDFFDTNQFRGRQYTLLDVLATTRKTCMLFQHACIPYRATVRQRVDYDYDVVHVELPNDGFVYTPTRTSPLSTRHKSGTWVSLPANAALECFPTVSSMCSPYYDHGRVYYNQHAERIDMELRPKQGNGLPVLMISFEPGYAEERAEWQPVFL